MRQHGHSFSQPLTATHMAVTAGRRLLRHYITFMTEGFLQYERQPGLGTGDELLVTSSTPTSHLQRDPQFRSARTHERQIISWSEPQICHCPHPSRKRLHHCPWNLFVRPHRQIQRSQAENYSVGRGQRAILAGEGAYGKGEVEPL